MENHLESFCFPDTVFLVYNSDIKADIILCQHKLESKSENDTIAS